MDEQQQEKLRRWWKKWSPIVVVVAAAIWTAVTALAAGAWSVYQFQKSTEQFMTKLEFDRAEAEKARWAAALEAEKNRTAEQKARDEARAATEADNAITRRIEAQKPFFEKRQDAYFEAIRVASRLTELNLATDSDEWKENVRIFAQMRWGELEMVGDPGIRNAARLVIEQIDHVANSHLDNRHNLRWSVECLADELRFSLEHSWGLQKGLKRETVLGQALVPKLPDGCNEGTEAALRPTGMPYPIGQVRRPQ